jgi:hypothetical protein
VLVSEFKVISESGGLTGVSKMQNEQFFIKSEKVRIFGKIKGNFINLI